MADLALESIPLGFLRFIYAKIPLGKVCMNQFLLPAMGSTVGFVS